MERWHGLTASFFGLEVRISMSLKEREHAGAHLLPGPKVKKKLMRSSESRLFNLSTAFQKESKKNVVRP